MESENQEFVFRLAFIGYPGYSYLLQPFERVDTPINVLLDILSYADSELRIIEALPWIILRYCRTDFHHIVAKAQSLHVQNQLGFMVNIASRISQTSDDRVPTETLRQIEANLDNVRKDGEFLLFPIRSTVQREWIVRNREPEAKHWGVLATLKPEHIDYESWLDESWEEASCVAKCSNIANHKRKFVSLD